MKVYNLKTGESFFRKKRRRFDEPGHAHELTFSCFRGFDESAPRLHEGHRG